MEKNNVFQRSREHARAHLSSLKLNVNKRFNFISSFFLFSRVCRRCHAKTKKNKKQIECERKKSKSTESTEFLKLSSSISKTSSIASCLDSHKVFILIFFSLLSLFLTLSTRARLRPLRIAIISSRKISFHDCFHFSLCLFSRKRKSERTIYEIFV